jgi:hypothetical protein
MFIKVFWKRNPSNNIIMVNIGIFVVGNDRASGVPKAV